MTAYVSLLISITYDSMKRTASLVSILSSLSFGCSLFFGLSTNQIIVSMYCFLCFLCSIVLFYWKKTIQTITSVVNYNTMSAIKIRCPFGFMKYSHLIGCLITCTMVMNSVGTCELRATTSALYYKPPFCFISPLFCLRFTITSQSCRNVQVQLIY